MSQARRNRSMFIRQFRALIGVLAIAVGVLVPAIAPVSAVADASTWTIRTSAADNLWNSVTYGGGLFVAVASSGTGNRVMTSPDGINWTIRTAAADNDWTSVTYGGGLFVAVSRTGSGNHVMTSPDGINWTIRTSAADNNWASVTYGDGLFVAVAQSGLDNRVMTSPDGINWTIRSSASNTIWAAVTHGDGLFVATSLTGFVMTSPDGSNWTIRTSAANNAWNSVTYGGGLFVAVALNGLGNRVMTSGPFSTTTTTTLAATTTTAAATTTTTAVATTTTAAVTTTTTAAVTTTATLSPTVTQPSAALVRSLAVREIVSSDNVTAGSSVKLTAGGFTPSESVLVGVLGSADTPSQVTADSRGAIATKVSIPTDADGKVTVYAYGQTSKRGYKQVVNVETAKELPATGSDTSPLTVFGVSLLATGLLFTARRRLVR